MDLFLAKGSSDGIAEQRKLLPGRIPLMRFSDPRLSRKQKYSSM